MSEHTEQKEVINWFEKNYKEFYECIFSIPNGTHLAGNAAQRAAKMNKLKAEGFKPGVSDLFLMIAKDGYHGLFIEMKDKGKTKCSVSTPQWEHIHRAREQGYYADWCAGAESAKELIDHYMNEKMSELKTAY